jgi:hypothetical protein
VAFIKGISNFLLFFSYVDCCNASDKIKKVDFGTATWEFFLFLTLEWLESVKYR